MYFFLLHAAALQTLLEAVTYSSKENNCLHTFVLARIYKTQNWIKK